MSKKISQTLFFLIIGAVPSYSFADIDYISNNNYLMNPYMGTPSGGGTSSISQSQLSDNGFFKNLFTTGTYNVLGAVSYGTLNSNHNFGYGVNIFAQTGTVAGLSVGGNLAIANPFFANRINPDNNTPNDSFQFLPTNQVIVPNELFIEYKIPNLFQIDAGWIYIDTPWLSSSDSLTLVEPTFQGILTNFQVNENVYITAFALNGYMPISSNYFSGLTLYNTKYDYATATPNIFDTPSSGSFAVGVQYGKSSNWKSQLWVYQFNNYANMIYGDSAYKLNINDNLNMTFSAQAGTQGTELYPYTNNVFAHAGYGAPQSNLLGLKYDFNYRWFEISASYNLVAGRNHHNSYEGGGLISPYTYQLASDPLYTTSTLGGLVEKSAGQAFKITPAINLFDGNLVISSSYAKYFTNVAPNSQEIDLTLTYAPTISGLKGLSFDAYFGFLRQDSTLRTNNNVQFLQLFASYLY